LTTVITAATPTPIPVIVLNSPDPVSIDSLHVAQATLGFTAAAFMIGIAALFLAGWALWTAVIDAKNNATQLAIALRRPELQVIFFDPPHDFDEAGTMTLDNGSKVPVLPRTLSIRNIGTRTSHNVRVELLVDRTAVVQETISPQDEASVFGKNCYRFTYDLNRDVRLYTDAPPHLFNAYNHRLKMIDDVVVYWRAFDDYGVYPVDNQGQATYGEIHVLSPRRMAERLASISG